MRVMMIPQIEDFRNDEGGVKRVIEAYYKYLPEYGVELVDKRENDFDVLAAHAGATGKNCDVAHLHGMYFTADYDASNWEYKANANIVNAVRTAKLITVPSAWVSEIFQRDMRINPVVIGHGIEADEWEHKFQHERYVLWNKNRMADVCDPKWADELAMKFDNTLFMSTFSRVKVSNMKVTGVLPRLKMKEVIQKAGVYLSTTKETFCIGNLEAMASGVPILGFRYGGNTEMVVHKVNGYLAEPYDINDLEEGLIFCMQNRDVLSKNCIEMAKMWSWEKPIKQVYDTYLEAMKVEQPTVSVIIPLYNGKDIVGKAIEGAFNQSLKPKEIIVVNDGSTDNPESVLSKYGDTPDTKFIIINNENGGVATARNAGIRRATSKYVSCLDKDDAIASEFLEVCVDELEKDRSLGIAYTGLMLVYADGSEKPGTWPKEFSYDRQVKGHNQIPTCCVFSKKMWKRLGGYKQRYAPMGAGSEDAEFWLRAGAYGFGAKKVTDKSLFLYGLNRGITSQPNYKEVDWTQWHPWTKDMKHPFSSYATPRGMSHPVRQYDEPKISVIIPVGSGHEKLVRDALDSLEAQFFRNWEAIVVWDSALEIQEELKTAYPYVRFVEHTGKSIGAGAARNLGVKSSRGYMLMFLDADDWLHPNAMSEMISAWNEENSIIYTDYVGKMQTSEAGIKDINLELLGYNPRTEMAIFKHNAAEYDCEKAQAQPDKSVYHWCLVTCLIPKEWHNAIDGFDEKMPSWEDVDYHWRMAKAGYCYFLIQQPLIMYRFYTGGRRESASGDRQNAITLLEYMRKKYKGIKMAGCRKCGGKRTSSGMTSARYVDAISGRSEKRKQISKEKGDTKMSNDSDFVLARYKHGNIGVHIVIGPASRINYGQHGGGEVFLIHKDDILLNPVLFEAIDKIPETGVRRPSTEVPQPIPQKDEARDSNLIANWNSTQVDDAEALAKEPTDEELLELVPGINRNIISGLKELGVHKVDDLIKFSEKELQSVKGIGKARSIMILEAARESIKARS